MNNTIIICLGQISQCRGVQTFYKKSHILENRRHKGPLFGDDSVSSINTGLEKWTESGLNVCFKSHKTHDLMLQCVVCPQVPKEKRILPVAKVVEMAEEQEKRSVRLFEAVESVYRQRRPLKCATCILAELISKTNTNDNSV